MTEPNIQRIFVSKEPKCGIRIQLAVFLKSHTNTHPIHSYPLTKRKHFIASKNQHSLTVPVQVWRVWMHLWWRQIAVNRCIQIQITNPSLQYCTENTLLFFLCTGSTTVKQPSCSRGPCSFVFGLQLSSESCISKCSSCKAVKHNTRSHSIPPHDMPGNFVKREKRTILSHLVSRNSRSMRWYAET